MELSGHSFNNTATLIKINKYYRRSKKATNT